MSNAYKYLYPLGRCGKPVELEIPKAMDNKNEQRETKEFSPLEKCHQWSLNGVEVRTMGPAHE